MKKRNLFWFFAILSILVILLILVHNLKDTSTILENNSGDECVLASDCVVVGQEEDCGCGCYGKDNVSISTETGCYCAVPTTCHCVNGYCEGIFE